MKIMFVKDYIDVDSYDKPLLVEATTVATLLDEVTGKILLDDIDITIDNVESSMYAPLRGELQ